MSFFKKFFGGNSKKDPIDPVPQPSLEEQLPKKRMSTIFPYLKFAGDGDAKPNDVFNIDDSEPQITSSFFTKPDGTEQKLDILCKKVLPDCLLFYGFDEGAVFIQVMPADLNAALRIDNLHLVAKENLNYFIENERPAEIRSAESGINMITCGGDYEASLLLFEEIWINLQQQLGGPLYVCVPARDMVLFTTIDNPAAVDEIKNLVKTQYHTYHRNMSKYLYKVEGNAWTVIEKIVE